MIKQAPLSFGMVWLVGAVITYILIRRSLRGQLTDLRAQLGDLRAQLGDRRAELADRDSVLSFLEKKLELQQKHLDAIQLVEQIRHPGILIEAPKENAAVSPANPQPPNLEVKSELQPPVLELMHFDFEDVAQDEAGFYFRAAKNLVRKAAILDFSLRPISGAVPWTEVQPQIRFKDTHGRVTRVSDAIWLGLAKPKVPFRYGMTCSLVLAVHSPKRDFRTYERDAHDQPLERKLAGNVIGAEVRLIGEYMDDPKADVYWYFKLIKGEVPQIIQSTREEFEASVSGNAQ